MFLFKEEHTAYKPIFPEALSCNIQYLQYMHV